MISCRQLESIAHIRHGFFGREGGMSSGLYASLNVGYGSGDEIDIISKNREIVAKALGANTPPLTCFQVHSNNVITVDKPWAWQDSPEADALVTTQKNIPIGVLTADCLPVLFADKKQHVIGAAHAGWKGARAGVLENTVEAMRALGATDIIATIGAAIAQPSYEVGAEFYQQFMDDDASNGVFFSPSSVSGHYLFNLPGYAKRRLQKKGLEQITILPYDTYVLEKQFYSYRRATHRKETVYGRQIAAIMLE